MCLTSSSNPTESIDIVALDYTEEDYDNDDDNLSEQSSPNVGGDISPRMEVNEVLNYRNFFLHIIENNIKNLSNRVSLNWSSKPF
jgi:hypothetical protein